MGNYFIASLSNYYATATKTALGGTFFVVAVLAIYILFSKKSKRFNWIFITLILVSVFVSSTVLVLLALNSFYDGASL